MKKSKPAGYWLVDASFVFYKDAVYVEISFFRGGCLHPVLSFW